MLTPKMRPRLVVQKSSPLPLLLGALFVVGFAIFFYVVLESRKEEKPPEPEASGPLALPSIEVDSALSTAAQHVTFSRWSFADPKPPDKRPQKISGLLRFESTDPAATLQGGLLGDVKYTVLGPSGVRLKVEDFRFGRLSSGDTAPVEMTFADWSKAGRVLIGPRLRSPPPSEK